MGLLFQPSNITKGKGNHRKNVQKNWCSWLFFVFKFFAVGHFFFHSIIQWIILQLKISKYTVEEKVTMWWIRCNPFIRRRLRLQLLACCMGTHIPPSRNTEFNVFFDRSVIKLHRWIPESFLYLDFQYISMVLKECSSKSIKDPLWINPATHLPGSQKRQNRKKTSRTWIQQVGHLPESVSLSTHCWGQNCNPKCLWEDVDKSDKKDFPHLDALDASFAVVAFDVDVNLCVANEAGYGTHKNNNKNKKVHVVRLQQLRDPFTSIRHETS